MRSVVPLLISLLFGWGCASYQIGQTSLYRGDIRTIHIPVFQSESFRRNLGEWLTEAVIKEVQEKTTYRIVNSAEADSFLTGRIINESKHVIATDINDFPRNIELDFLVEVVWRDRQGNVLGSPFIFSLPPSLIQVAQSSSFIPESGQSLVTAQQRAIEQLAEQIVAQLEIPW